MYGRCLREPMEGCRSTVCRSYRQWCKSLSGGIRGVWTAVVFFFFFLLCLRGYWYILLFIGSAHFISSSYHIMCLCGRKQERVQVNKTLGSGEKINMTFSTQYLCFCELAHLCSAFSTFRRPRYLLSTYITMTLFLTHVSLYFPCTVLWDHLWSQDCCRDTRPVTFSIPEFCLHVILTVIIGAEP